MPLTPEERERLEDRYQWVSREVAKFAAAKARPDENLSDLERWYLKELDEIEFALEEE